MCTYCNHLKDDKRRILVMKNGRPDTYGITSLEMTTLEDSVYLAICEKPGDGETSMLMKSFVPIHFCPFCGEKL